MPEMEVYTCPGCSGEVIYDRELQVMRCKYCYKEFHSLNLQGSHAPPVPDYGYSYACSTSSSVALTRKFGDPW